MKAIVYTKYGTPDVLQLNEVDKPIPQDDEVLIKVYAASLNDWDWGLLQGDFVNRMLNGFIKPKIKTLGSDIAGRVDGIGKNVRTLSQEIKCTGILAAPGEVSLSMSVHAKMY